MNIEQVREYTLSLLGVTEDQPFGDDIITFRLEGKIFVCLWLGGGKYDMKNGEPRIALKLSPERNELLRAQFPAVTPAYHWNKKHWSDVYYEQLDDAQVEEWIRLSYIAIIISSRTLCRMNISIWQSLPVACYKEDIWRILKSY